MCSYTPEQKAQVMADLLSGMSINQCVEKYDIPRGTVGKWSASLARETGGNTKKEETGELIVCMLDENLAKLREMLHTIDDAYLRQQPAGEFATLYGVISDKTFRILDGISRREDRDRAEADTTDLDEEAEA